MGKGVVVVVGKGVVVVVGKGDVAVVGKGVVVVVGKTGVVVGKAVEVVTTLQALLEIFVYDLASYVPGLQVNRLVHTLLVVFVQGVDS